MIHHPKKKYSTNRINTKGEKVLIDGECDTSLVIDGFIIQSTVNCSPQGFIDDIKIESLPIVQAVATID